MPKQTVSIESALIARAQRGDRSAFAKLYETYAPLIYGRVLMPKLGRADAAEDALADTFTSAFERLSRFEDQGKGLYPWLCRIAANKALDVHRARRRRQTGLTNFESMLAPLLPEPVLPDARLQAANDADAIRAEIARVLGSLRPRYRRAIELRFLEARPRAECADALDVKIGTFDVLLLRALKAFRANWRLGDE
ncbi:MAG: RNA polymerase sigma factor [Myxococcota bacterium]